MIFNLYASSDVPDVLCKTYLTAVTSQFEFVWMHKTWHSEGRIVIQAAKTPSLVEMVSVLGQSIRTAASS